MVKILNQSTLWKMTAATFVCLMVAGCKTNPSSVDAGVDNLNNQNRQLPDAGSSDAGSDGGHGDYVNPNPSVDAGVVCQPPAAPWPPDPISPVPLPNPAPAGWQYLTAQNNFGPHEIYAVTTDGIGNVWVAAGRDGLFLAQLDTKTSQYAYVKQFTLADGLTGYDDGCPSSPGNPSTVHPLPVISVTGGPANTVFVGYHGLDEHKSLGLAGCEEAWEIYTGAPYHYVYDAKHKYIWKSGDADRVVYNPTSGKIAAVHYDISSGPGIVSAEPQGREKICSILRMAYDLKTNSIWFGGNHGMARGDATSTPPVIVEHSHPAINGYTSEDITQHPAYLTDAYYGMSVLPNGDLWFGGANRSALFTPRTTGVVCADDFFNCDDHVNAEGNINKLDFWPDAQAEYAPPSKLTEDNVSDMAAYPDGSVWASSLTNGLIHWVPGGTPLRLNTVTDVDPKGRASALERDASDESLWVGFAQGGLVRLQGPDKSVRTAYGANVFTAQLAQGAVSDIQSDTFQGKRRLLAALQSSPPLVAIYTGP